ncbi:MAG TPA: choice-of-anchor D domain-containing protein, partial [Candidatus Polarisedimenticolia bacterium]|nr:choice-of-anchor D domain-containing protein [Candidatus Polarisedimenticolia bacterium]
DEGVFVVLVSGDARAPVVLPSPESIDFGDVPESATETRTLTVKNTGNATLHLLAATFASGSSADFSAGPPASSDVAPGDSTTIALSYTPSSIGAASATLVINSTNAASRSVPLSGTGVAPALSVTPAALDFGDVRVGRQALLQVTLRNTGSAGLTIDSLALAPAGDPAFAIVTPPALPIALAPGGEQVINVGFSPSAAGPVTGALVVGSATAGVRSVPLAGNGVVGSLSVTPTALDFGNVNLGASAARSVTLRNTGSVDLNVLSVALSIASSSAFSVGALGSSPLPPGGLTTFDVTFAPTSSGPATGAVEIVTDGGLATVTLSGYGVVPGGEVVGLDLSVAGISLPAGDCYQARLFARLSNGTSQEVTATAAWASLDAARVEVVSPGLVRGLQAGEASVSASFSGFTAVLNVSVQPPGTLRLLLPCGEVASGSTIEGEIVIDVGARALGAYALRIFHGDGMRITGVRGGLSAAFAAAPAADPASFANPATVIAAYQVADLDAPTGVISLARVTFQVTGPPGGSTGIGLTPLTLAATDLTDIAATNQPVIVQVAP